MVATSSLELGIDMGSVDLVVQVAAPLSIASGLQRVGRADHNVGGVSHALFFPITRQQIIGVTTSMECMREGAIEPLHMPRNPLDVLAQQTVAAAAMEDLSTNDWYELVRRSAPFQNLDRSMFDAVIGMMTGAYNSESFSAFRPRCNTTKRQS
ncbi:MAG: helicase-related protein [Bifidobacterium sp.]